MQPNRSSNGIQLSSEQNRGRLVFNRIDRYLGRLSKTLAAENVHRFRTNSRRVEAVLGQLAPETRNKKKLLKSLSRLRKKAGKLRDVDVQIAFLKELKVPDRQNHRAQLLETLEEERLRRSRKLAKALDTETVRELRNRLRRARAEAPLDGVDPLRCAFACLPKPGAAPLSERSLHECRVAAKQARYLAELAADSADAKAFVTELKRAQDAVGEWHDVLKLKERAEQRFGSAHDSALVSVLQNISRARFRRAVNALLGALGALSELQRGSEPAQLHKSVASDSQLHTTAVA
jgi:CHAD domain-containing protein